MEGFWEWLGNIMENSKEIASRWMVPFMTPVFAITNMFTSGGQWKDLMSSPFRKSFVIVTIVYVIYTFIFYFIKLKEKY